MLHYAPRQLSKKLQQNNINSLNQLQRQKANKYSQTLKFMTEWSNDLLEREHQFTTNQQQLNLQLLQIETKSKTFRSQKTQQSLRNNTSSHLDIQKMIQQEFIKKLQDVYTKQILLYESSQPHNQTFNSEELSQHHQSVQSSQSSQNHQRLSSNFSNYFNGYECHTDSKNNQQSIGSQNISKASELIQQQYFSNQVEEEPEQEQQFYSNSQHHQTYEENFISE